MPVAVRGFGLVCVLLTAALPVVADPEPARTATETAASEARNQDNTEYLESVLQLENGQFRQAVTSARIAYRRAVTRKDRLRAARVVAAAQYNLGHFTRAEWWLRRGSNDVETQQDAVTLAQEFRAVRQQNPLSLRLGLSVAPTNNINRGTDDRTFTLGEFLLIFNPASRALSGVEYAADAELSYRLYQGSDHSTRLSLYLYGRTYTLSSDSQAAVPHLSGSDYALGLAEVSLFHDRLLFDGLGPTRVSAHVGEVWNAGDPAWTYRKLSLSQGFLVAQTASLTLRGSVEDQTGLTPAQPDAVVYEVESNFAHRLANLDVWRFSLGVRHNVASLATYTYKDYRASLSYDIDRPVLGSRVSVSVGVGTKSFEEFSLSLDGRRDRYVTLGATAVFEQISYFGFSPVWSVTATRTDSNVTRFSTREVTGRIGLQSKF